MESWNYAPPLDKLLDISLDIDQKFEDWADYVGMLNLTQEHIPELIRMATDKKLRFSDAEDESYAGPVHAWRALGQLRAQEAAQPLTANFSWNNDDWVAAALF